MKITYTPTQSIPVACTYKEPFINIDKTKKLITIFDAEEEITDDSVFVGNDYNLIGIDDFTEYRNGMSLFIFEYDEEINKENTNRMC